MSSLTWANGAKNFRLAPASNSVKYKEIDGAASALNFGELNLFDTWFTYNNQTWVVKRAKFDSSFISYFVRHQTWFLRYREIFYINSTNYWRDFGIYLSQLLFNLPEEFKEEENLFSVGKERIKFNR
jgi:hypothetical protein